MSGTVHVIGAGLAGLSAATALVAAGRRVVVHEATKTPGGRCRSYFDPALDLEIDNGNHLLLSGNTAALDFVRRIGGSAALDSPAAALFHFADLKTAERWTLRPNAGRVPWWIFVASRRVPGTRARDYLGPLGILRAGPQATIAEAMSCRGPIYDRLWQPVLLAALNTDPRISAACLAAPVLRETLGAGGAACRPVVATGGLSAAFIDPALAFLARHHVEIRLGSRLRTIERAGERVASLAFAEGPVALGSDDAVLIATPPWVAGDLLREALPDITVPNEFRSIVNAHFRVAPPPGQPLLLGVVGGLTEWLFAYSDRLSVTISGADRLLDTPRETLAGLIWAEVSALTGLSPELPRWQIVKERRATFAATPEQVARRPASRTALDNLALAGDWTDTGLPATIEGAVRSGNNAAAVLQGRHGRP